MGFRRLKAFSFERDEDLIGKVLCTRERSKTYIHVSHIIRKSNADHDGEYATVGVVCYFIVNTDKKIWFNKGLSIRVFAPDYYEVVGEELRQLTELIFESVEQPS